MADFPAPPFAGETDDIIRSRMLDAVSPDFIKVEGDVVYDMLQPAALEIERAYNYLETQFGEAFPATATGEYLDALALDRTGLVRVEGESDDAFRVKVLAALATPPGAGSQRDFRAWLADVPGLGPVTAESTAPGEITVWVIADDHDIADAGLIADAQDVLDVKAPITATATAAGATLVRSGDLSISLTSATAAQVTTWTAAIEAYMATLEPGRDWRIETVLAEADIPPERYLEHNFAGAIGSPLTAATSETFRATSVTIVT